MRARHIAIGVLGMICLLDVTLLFAADSTTQPTTKSTTRLSPATTQAQARADNSQTRDNRQNRDYGNRDRRRNRDRDRGNTSTPVVAPVQSDPFTILKSRSIFVKGNQAISSGGSGTGQTSSQVQGELAHKPEASLVFNGVTVIDGQANAFIEDLTADRVSTVRKGDGIAGGKVSNITFDTLSYEANGKVLNVALGQNLQGNTALATNMDSTPGAATTGPTTLPFTPGYIGVGGGSGVITTGMSAEDILARMKAKRQAELGR